MKLSKDTLKKYLKTKLGIAIIALGILAIPSIAYAVVVVSDPSGYTQQIEAVRQASRQLDALNEQITTLKEQRDQMINTGQAIGRKSRIVVAAANLDELGQTLKSSIQCLIPSAKDLSRMMPGIDMKDLDLKSTCDVARVYGNALFVNPDDPRFQRDNIEKRRELIFINTVVDGLSSSTSTLATLDSTNQAIDELDAQANAADDMNERLAVIAKGQILNARINAQLLQVNNDLLRMQSSERLVTRIPSHYKSDILVQSQK